jgi:type I restriction enzyme, R subunit
LWHRLGAKTIELIHQNIHVDAVRDDLDTLVLDAELLEAVLGNPDPDKKAKEISIKLTGRLRKHGSNPKFKALSERLEDLKNRHQQGLLISIDFLKELLALAKDVVKLERETPPEEGIDQGKAALTELFEEAKNGDTPIMVQRVVDDIDEIVGALPGLAGHACWRARGQEGAPADALQVQASPRHGAIRTGLWVHSRVLLNNEHDAEEEVYL